MNAKDYLSQAWRVDRMVSAKLGQVTSLHLLAEKASSTLSDMPRNPAPNTHRMEDIIVKIVDQENEINGAIDRLVDLKREIGKVIKDMENPDHQVLLELRYLAFLSWDEVARDMRYSISRVYVIHQDALTVAKIPEPD
jgi:DNA-directed RNA polymerase specialized sigma subunit